MTEKKTNVVTIDDINYDIDKMTEAQREALDNVIDLERKIATGLRNVRQMQGGREFWVTQLASMLKEEPDVAAE